MGIEEISAFNWKPLPGVSNCGLSPCQLNLLPFSDLLDFNFCVISSLGHMLCSPSMVWSSIAPFSLEEMSSLLPKEEFALASWNFQSMLEIRRKFWGLILSEEEN